MSDRIESGIQCATASFATRVWRWLGYFGQFNEVCFEWRQNVPKGGDMITVHTTVRVSFGDRLRILFSGHFEVVTYTKTTVEIGKAESMSEVRILP